MQQSNLTRLIYRSRKLATESANLEQLLDVSRSNNRRDGLTGLLLHDRTWFLQLLEGKHDAIARCFLRIASDPRHAQLEVGMVAPAAARICSSWDLAERRVRAGQTSLPKLWRGLSEAVRDGQSSRVEEILLTEFV